MRDGQELMMEALPAVTSRYSRFTLMQPFKRALLDGLGHGLAHEGMAIAAMQR